MKYEKCVRINNEIFDGNDHEDDGDGSSGGDED